MANRLASPFYSVFPFYLAPLFYSVSPFYSVIKDQFIFICHPFAPAATATAAPTLTASSRPRPRPRPRFSIDRRLFVPAKCVRIKKLCKTHYKCYYTTMIYAPVFYTPHYCPSSYPSKKNNYFLSTSHLVYPFQKSVVLLTYVRKKKYNANGVVLHVVMTKNGWTVSVIIRLNVGKKFVKNKTRI